MLRSLLATAGVAAAILPLAATPAQAATPVVEIIKVFYDSPGSDRGGNASLNGEYAVLRNTTRKSIQLERWILRDRTGYKYRFPRFTLRPGKTVTVRSGQGTDTRTTLYWGRKWYVWNNDGDRASLYRGSDLKKIDTCDWGRGGTSTRCR
ncbi:lamin tail domain-containing protein [Nonomuraea phyllanthi]|uniref:lamin tail domain-containing protein n=1 Tax=Nonomuraea phyllanthi TaxID=2219224 RepID=UPI001D15CB52|nr:lamin tail domain-containing protein [Nonomuraea phyllanthi]